MKSMCHQSRRNSPSVTSCMPTDSCFATASRTCLSCRARSASVLISPRLAFACAALAAPGALAQAYPSQPIKVVVPFTPGTGMDIIARTVGPKLSERLGQPIVVENKPGASGNIGAEMVAKSPPDGHTVMITANTMLIAASLYHNVPYDPLTV